MRSRQKVKSPVLLSLVLLSFVLSGSAASAMKILPSNVKIDPKKAMGDWFVQVAVPTAFDKGAHNGKVCSQALAWPSR